VARELGLRLLAPLLVVLVMSNDVFLSGEITRDFAGYRAEDVGRGLAFAGLALGIRAVRKRRRVDAVVAGLLLVPAEGPQLLRPAAHLASLHGPVVPASRPGLRGVRGAVDGRPVGPHAGPGRLGPPARPADPGPHPGRRHAAVVPGAAAGDRGGGVGARCHVG